MSAPETAPLLSIRRGSDDDPAFPAPWAARAFALAVSLQERGIFSAAEWASALGAAIAGQAPGEADDPEAYWRAWLIALEGLLKDKRVAAPGELAGLRDAWRDAAQATPHGEPIELRR